MALITKIGAALREHVLPVSTNQKTKAAGSAVNDGTREKNLEKQLDEQKKREQEEEQKKQELNAQADSSETDETTEEGEEKPGLATQTENIQHSNSNIFVKMVNSLRVSKEGLKEREGNLSYKQSKVEKSKKSKFRKGTLLDDEY